MTEKTYKIVTVCVEAAEALTVGLLPICLSNGVLAGAISTFVVAVAEATLAFLKTFVKADVAEKAEQ